MKYMLLTCRTKFAFIRLGTITNWDIISHLLVKHPYWYLCLLTKWESKSMHSQLCVFSNTAHHVMWRDNFLRFNYFIENDFFKLFAQSRFKIRYRIITPDCIEIIQVLVHLASSNFHMKGMSSYFDMCTFVLHHPCKWDNYLVLYWGSTESHVFLRRTIRVYFQDSNSNS
jgi:hypothetical protein